MANNRVDIDLKEQQIQNIENANFVLLSLYREYSIKLLNGHLSKEDCISKMKQIKKDIKYLDKQELISKVKYVYIPILKQLTQGNEDE